MNLDKIKADALAELSAADLSLVIQQQTINIIDLLKSKEPAKADLYKASKIHKDISEFMADQEYYNNLVYGIVNGLLIAILSDAGTYDAKVINYLLHDNVSFNHNNDADDLDDVTKQLIDEYVQNIDYLRDIKEYDYIIHGKKCSNVFDFLQAETFAHIEALEHGTLDVMYIIDVDNDIDNDAKQEHLKKLKQLNQLLAWYNKDKREFTSYIIDDDLYNSYLEAKAKIKDKYTDLSEFHALNQVDKENIIKAIINLGDNIES